MKISDFGLTRYDGYQTKRQLQSTKWSKPPYAVTFYITPAIYSNLSFKFLIEPSRCQLDGNGISL